MSEILLNINDVVQQCDPNIVQIVLYIMIISSDQIAKVKTNKQTKQKKTNRKTRKKLRQFKTCEAAHGAIRREYI